MTKYWWQEPVRMLVVNYSDEFAKLKNEDLDQLARNRREEWQINCEWIVGTPGYAGQGHLTSFHADGYSPALGFEAFDLLRNYTPHAHRYGIRAVAYLNMHWYAYEFGDRHTDWEQVMSDGRRYGRVHPLYRDGTTFCVNGPWRDWAFGLIEAAMKTGIDGVFLDGPVIYPSCCYCDSCRRLFMARHGQTPPTEDWQNPLWAKFLDFREESMARFLADAQRAMRQVNPEGVIFLNASAWGPESWRVARDNQKVAPFQNFNGAESFFHHGNQNLYDTLMTGKFLRAVDLPAVVFTSVMNGLWHSTLLPAGEIQLAIIQTLASGANPWLAVMEVAARSQPQARRPIRDLFAFQEKHRHYYSDLKPVAEVGLFFSKRTGRSYLSRFKDLYERSGATREVNLIIDRQDGKAADWSARKVQCEELLAAAWRGYFHALTRAHVPFDVLLDRQIVAEKISRYKTIVLPDGACLTPQEMSVLKSFVKNGGHLVASFEAGFYDENGRPTKDMFDLYGIQEVEGLFPVMTGENYARVTQDFWGWSKDDLVERGPYALKVTARTGAATHAFFMEPIESFYAPLKGLSPCPALIVHPYGRGNVIYFPEAIGAFYGETAMPSAEARIVQAVQFLNGPPLVEAEAPKSVSVEVFRQEVFNRVIIHLVNNAVDRRPVSEFLPVRNITLKLNCKEAPRRITALRENRELQTSSSEGGLLIQDVSLSLYEVIVVEY